MWSWSAAMTTQTTLKEQKQTAIRRATSITFPTHCCSRATTNSFTAAARMRCLQTRLCSSSRTDSNENKYDYDNEYEYKIRHAPLQRGCAHFRRNGSGPRSGCST